MDIGTWKDQVRKQRQQKDEFFLLHRQSPIPEEDRLQFDGLRYYPPDPDYRFELELDIHPTAETLRVDDTSGGERELIRGGEFRFTIDGHEYALQVYQSEPGEPRLFIPFRDETSGDETYGAGRYLDLEPERHLISDNRWILDFNQAYNPWCAYSDDYVCPFVPPENWLDVPIRAGEKNYRS